MAPAIKELSRWLDANSEYYVAPDWADVVKHSVSYIFTLCLFSEGVETAGSGLEVRIREPFMNISP